jgi:hypothetical protein
MSGRRGGRRLHAIQSGFHRAAFVLCFWAPAAHAGSINANTGTYAGDVAGLNFPVGTVAVSNYTAYRHGGTFYSSTGAADKTGKVDIVTNVARFDWIAAKLAGMPLVLSAALPYGYVDGARLEGQDASTHSSFFSPNVFITLGAIVDPQSERTLGISTYLFFPVGDYDSTKDVNAATPNQTVITPQFAYAEGLGKLSPALKNVSIDIFGGAAFHSDGDNPVTAAGVGGFDRTEQENSYDANIYLRYNWNPLTFIAVGIEQSWGGEQIARGGALGALGGESSIGKDEYVKGHLQFGIPLSETVQIAADITHDFHREGGFKEDFTAEIRLSTFVTPLSGPMK